MKKAFLFSVAFLFIGTNVHSQTPSDAQIVDGSVELVSWVVASPKPVNGKVYMTQATHDSSRFDLVNLNKGCRTMLCIVYGDRYGNNWDIFHIGGGPTSQTRMVQIGEYRWTDSFTVPNVEPWRELAPGETRTVSVNTSGANGANGSNAGRGLDQDTGELASASFKNEDYANARLQRQVGSTVKSTEGKVRKDSYTPVVEAKLGYMYVVRVKDPKNDYYVVIRVDELTRGERVVLSYKKMEIPKSVL